MSHVDTGRTWAQHAPHERRCGAQASRICDGEGVLVPLAQRVTTITEIVLQGDTFGYRLAGLGQAVSAEAEMERIWIDGRQKVSLTPRESDG